MQQEAGHEPAAIFPPLPRSPEEIARSFDWFRDMREGHPVLREESMGMPCWHVFRYDDVATVLTDHARFSSRSTFQGLLSETLLVKDPPDHRKLRNLVNLAFTPRAVARLSGRVAEITQELLDRVRSTGEMNVVSDFAFPLPARVIAEMLGVPDEDWGLWQRFARADSTSELDPSTAAEMQAYFSALLDERRRSPREDLVTALSRAEVDGQRLTERELVSFCVLLLIAGQETTKNLIANFVLTLSDHPEDHARLLRQPELMPAAIEEVLRYLPPVWFLMRRTTTEVDLAGVRIPADQLVMPWMASANRDPSQFPESDRFDITRDPNRHVSFGHGIHFCVGAPLSRLEARVALPMMLDQLVDLQVVRSAPIDIQAGIVFLITRLPVTFRPS